MADYEPIAWSEPSTFAIDDQEDPDWWPREQLYPFEQEQVVKLMHCGPGECLGMNQDDNIVANVPYDDENPENAENIMAEWDAIPSLIDGKVVVTFRSRKNGKYLQIEGFGGVISGDKDEDNQFRVKRLGHSVFLESVHYEGKHFTKACLAVNAENNIVTEVEKYISDDDQTYSMISFQVTIVENPQPKGYDDIQEAIANEAFVEEEEELVEEAEEENNDRPSMMDKAKKFAKNKVEDAAKDEDNQQMAKDKAEEMRAKAADGVGCECMVL